MVGQAYPRPAGLLRVFFKVPPLLYRIGLARQAGRRFLLLTTVGRRSGQPRTSALNYAEDRGTIYVVAGFGPRTDWYRNLLAEPRVRLQIGTRALDGVARPVASSEERQRAFGALQAAADSQGPPEGLRPLMRRFGFDYDAELRRLDPADESLIVVAVELAAPASAAPIGQPPAPTA